MALDVRFGSASLLKLHPGETGDCLDSVLAIFAARTTEFGGVLTPTTGSTFFAIFGAEPAYADHAWRAILASLRIKSDLLNLASQKRDQGIDWPRFAIGVHAGELLFQLSQSNEGNSSGMLGFGQGWEIVRTIALVGAPGEVLLSEPVLHSVFAKLPDGFELQKVLLPAEPDTSGLRWDYAMFEGLPERQRARAWLLGEGVTSNHSSATATFSFLTTVKIPESNAGLLLLRAEAEKGGRSIPLGEETMQFSDPARRIGKYVVLGKLGHGGMGQVYLGRDGFGNLAAVKVRHQDSIDDAKSLARFEREARIMSELPHRNICRVLEVGEFEGLRFIAMEYIQGATLQELLTKGVGAFNPKTESDLPSLLKSIRKFEDAPPPEPNIASATSSETKTRRLHTEQILELAKKVCTAVQYAHEHGILHRDLKPANIMIREDGDPVVCDFGLAKIAVSEGSSLSMSGEVFGTIDFMAPEQAADSARVDERADVYSIGAMLYLMFTGRKHFETTGNLLNDIPRIASHEVLPLRRHDRKIHPDLEVIIMKSLRTARDQRYRSVLALKSDLERFQLGEPVLARPVTLTQLATKLYQRHRAAANSAAIGIILLMVVGAHSLQLVNERRVDAEQALALAEEAQIQMQTALERSEKAGREAAEALKISETALKARQKAEAAARNAEKARKREVELRAAAEQAVKASELDMEAIMARMQRSSASPQTPYINQQLGYAEADVAFDRAVKASEQSFRNMAARVPQTLLEPLLTMSLNTPDTGNIQRLRGFEEYIAALQSIQTAAVNTIILKPTLPRAQLLQGRAALVRLDIERARDAFQNALDLAESSSDTQAQAEAEKLLGILPDPNTPASFWMPSIFLNKAPLFDLDTETADILQFALRAIQITKRTAPLPYDFQRALNHGGDFIPGNLAVQIAGSNPTAVFRVEIRPESPQHRYVNCTLRIMGRDVTDLSYLPRFLADGQMFSAYDFSYTTAPLLPFFNAGDRASLTAVGSGFVAFQGIPQFASINLSDSSFQVVAGFTESQFLSTLILNGCALENPEALFTMKSSPFFLRHLEIARMDIPSLNGIENLKQIQTLKFSPARVEDKDSIEILRFMPQLSYISGPDDPSTQSAAIFWAKYDSGAYEGTGQLSEETDDE